MFFVKRSRRRQSALIRKIRLMRRPAPGICLAWRRRDACATLNTWDFDGYAFQGFSGTSITSPSRSQKAGAGLESLQSSTHSRALPDAGSRRVTFTRERSEEDNNRLEALSTGLIQKGALVSTFCA